MWVMGEWAVGQWIVGVTSFRKMYGYMGLRSIGSDQLDRFRTQRYNHKKKIAEVMREDCGGYARRILPLLGRTDRGPTNIVFLTDSFNFADIKLG